MPRSPRVMICACEDVTLSDVEKAIELGYRDIESIKRFTGLGTGSCQARCCQHQLARILSTRGTPSEDLHPITARPPLSPLSLGILARLDTSRSQRVPAGMAAKDSATPSKGHDPR